MLNLSNSMLKFGFWLGFYRLKKKTKIFRHFLGFLSDSNMVFISAGKSYSGNYIRVLQ